MKTNLEDILKSLLWDYTIAHPGLCYDESKLRIQMPAFAYSAMAEKYHLAVDFTKTLKYQNIIVIPGFENNITVFHIHSFEMKFGVLSASLKDVIILE